MFICHFSQEFLLDKYEYIEFREVLKLPESQQIPIRKNFLKFYPW